MDIAVRPMKLQICCLRFKTRSRLLLCFLGVGNLSVVQGPLQSLASLRPSPHEAPEIVEVSVRYRSGVDVSGPVCLLVL